MTPEQSTGELKPVRQRQIRDKVITASISAISAVITTLIAGGVTIYQAKLAAEKAATEAAESSVSATQSAENARRSEEKAARIARADATLAAAKCPSALTSDGIPSFSTYGERNVGKEGAAVELLNADGPGCLIGGEILGHNFQHEKDGRNFTILIELDGRRIVYPMSTNKIVSAAHDQRRNSMGVLVLPQIAFQKSLRITYYYTGGGNAVAAHALVTSRID